MTYDQGALLEPLAVAVHAVRKAGLATGSSCLIIGAGAVGLLCAAAAREVGCPSITMADIATNRLQFALDHGFATAVSLMGRRQGNTVEEELAVAKDVAGQLAAAESNKTDAKPRKFAATFECTGVESCVQTAIFVSRFCFPCVPNTQRHF